MDPDAAYATMVDTSLPDDERRAAAEALKDWLHGGGFTPIIADPVTGAASTRFVVYSRIRNVLRGNA